MTTDTSTRSTSTDTSTTGSTSTETTVEARPVHQVVRGRQFHWVGDGFRVTNLFPSAADLGERISPFILLDYHAPYEYSPTDRPRGVGVHPHRGFETVTLAFEGSVAHHDSTGAGGVIHPGDVQWMTAASGVLHKEYHEAEWAKQGGRFHMVQLWVNLPAANKMDEPGYQSLTAEQIGAEELPNGAGVVRVIAGSYAGHTGPARTASPIDLWDVQLNGTAPAQFEFAAERNVSFLVLEGGATVNGARALQGDLVVLDNVGSGVTVEPDEAGRLLVLSGEPLGEPVVAHGPFVMNTRDEIIQAYRDFEAGRFGYLED